MDQPQGPQNPVNKKMPIGTIITMVVIFGIFLFAVITSLRSSAASLDKAVTGDCLKLDSEGAKHTYTRADCESNGAQYKIFGIIENGTTNDCVEVPGTSRTTRSKTNVLCVGEKDVDVAKTINNIKEGECVITKGETAQKADCSEPSSAPVLKVLKNQVKSTVATLQGGTVCDAADVEGTKRTYSWGITQVGAGAIKDVTWDRVLCLGASKA